MLPQAEVAYSNVTTRPIACSEDLSRAHRGNWSRLADRAEWPWMTARRRLKRIERYHRERFDYDNFPAQSREVTAQVELWDDGAVAVERVLAFASHSSTGYAAYYAAISLYPTRQLPFAIGIAHLRRVRGAVFKATDGFDHQNSGHGA